MEQEELARLCENTQDKDYIIFLINEGWKCRDETDALVRYTRRWCNFISNPGKVSAGEWGGCMASSGIISARAAMAFSTAFSSVSLNISMTIFATNLTSC